MAENEIQKRAHVNEHRHAGHELGLFLVADGRADGLRGVRQVEGDVVSKWKVRVAILIALKLTKLY